MGSWPVVQLLRTGKLHTDYGPQGLPSMIHKYVSLELMKRRLVEGESVRWERTALFGHDASRSTTRRCLVSSDTF